MDLDATDLQSHWDADKETMRPADTPDELQAEIDAAPAPAERLLLWAMRGWASLRTNKRPPQPWAHQALTTRASQRTAALFIAWMQALEAGQRRPLALGCDGCGAMSQDEARLILACGLASSASAASTKLLEPLVHEPEAVIVLASTLGKALAASGWPLPVRRSPAAAAAATLH